nr:MAG: nonstructural protein [Microviridae sp.]
MLVRMYTIFDKVAEDSAPPFAAVNDGVARRQFNNLIAATSTPDEYVLYYLGTYSTITMIVSFETPVEVLV